jgi:putative heme iron utilization protein
LLGKFRADRAEPERDGLHRAQSTGHDMDAIARRREAIRLLAEQVWFALATVDAGGFPTISYIPFAIVGAAFGVVVSRLAAHTSQLLAGRRASVLLVDSYAELSDAYVRSRFSISVNASPLTADSSGANAIWSALERRQGDTVQTLRMLPDFTAISLEPINGRLVLGFASAYDLKGDAVKELLENAG